MKKIHFILFMIALAYCSTGPFTVDMLAMRKGWDRQVPVNIPGGWIGYLLFVGFDIFMLCIIGWYHFSAHKIQKNNEPETNHKSRAIKEQVVFITSLIVGVAFLAGLTIYV